MCASCLLRKIKWFEQIACLKNNEVISIKILWKNETYVIAKNGLIMNLVLNLLHLLRIAQINVIYHGSRLPTY